jgi:hypothetical protein
MTRHLRPLAIAANVIQASFCRLDTVLLTFGYLVMQYTQMMETDNTDSEGCHAIINSIEKRWGKADQELFIAAVLLNPYYWSVPFSPLRFLSYAGIDVLLDRLWVRVFRKPVPLEFNAHVREYLTNTGIYVDLPRACHAQNNIAEQAVR